MTCYTLYNMKSKLQIISGNFRGRKILLPDSARPTQNKARGAIFNMLASDVLSDTSEPYFAWDAFAGSGALGIEFLSRYPNSYVVFTDSSDDAVKAIQKNLIGIGSNSKSYVEKVDAFSVIKKYANKTKVLFLDPPYVMKDAGDIFMKKFEEEALQGTIVVWEQEKENFIMPSDKWVVLKDKIYGRARFLILKLKEK